MAIGKKSTLHELGASKGRFSGVWVFSQANDRCELRQI